jgi:hypothetical protein
MLEYYTVIRERSMKSMSPIKNRTLVEPLTLQRCSSCALQLQSKVFNVRCQVPRPENRKHYVWALARAANELQIDPLPENVLLMLTITSVDRFAA